MKINLYSHCYGLGIAFVPMKLASIDDRKTLYTWTALSIRINFIAWLLAINLPISPKKPDLL